jgi:16S rRNA (adenine1518-N6/adenine1519-N6)-dimethyltransferase
MNQSGGNLPRKSLGQHFLTDRGIIRRILSVADLDLKDHVVEIGPGRGHLTGAIVERVGSLVAVEIDQNLVSDLKERFFDQANVTILSGDAREVDFSLLTDVGKPYKLVANLPYYAAMPIIRRFLGSSYRPSMMVIMVQREVAQQMVAQPGDMGLVSVAIQLYGRPKIVAHVPPRSFRPQPKVTSTIVRIDPFDSPVVDFDREENFFRVVKAGFSAPRKQLRNSLKNGLNVESDIVDKWLEESGIDPVRRAQTLTLDEWALLYKIFYEMV